MCSSGSLLLELEAEFGEELNGGVDVFYHDADVVHTLDRHDVSLASRHNDCRSKRLTSVSQRGLASGEVRAAGMHAGIHHEIGGQPWETVAHSTSASMSTKIPSLSPTRVTMAGRTPRTSAPSGPGSATSKPR